MSTCPCCSQIEYDQCCEPLITGVKSAETAEQLMRSRYTAYVNTAVNYLEETIHPDQRSDFDKNEARAWSETSQWKQLEILNTIDGQSGDKQGIVEFIAHFINNKNVAQKHHERAEFKKEGGHWYFFYGEFVKPASFKRDGPKIGRNDPCHCGSGKKYKKCCA
ncbi:MAG: SEC-C domain-containing protein [Desulfamplus sp.]|nr:SEC-C domain-containing protein [Desulfamplus sp.]